MFSIENLQNNSQEVGERFSHLVTFDNTYGFNGKDIRISFPKRFYKISIFNSDSKIEFNEDNISISFNYKPNVETTKYLEELNTEIKNNNKFLNRFKNSKENIKVQFFTKSDLDGECIIYNNVKLNKINNKFFQNNENNTLLKTTLTFSFKNISYDFLSIAKKLSDNEIEKKVENFKNIMNKIDEFNQQLNHSNDECIEDNLSESKDSNE